MTSRPSSTWKEALDARTDLVQFGDNAIGLFALELSFKVDDILSVASDSITDGNDDKKCDIIYLDKEAQIAVVAQCYFCKTNKPSAPANKASDLNTAVAWLLQQDIKVLPAKIKSAAQDLRESIRNGSITKVEAWYIHNLAESANVKSELATVEATMNSIVTSRYSGVSVEVSTKEVGNSVFGQLYLDTQTPILVSESYSFDINGGFEIAGTTWKSYVTAVQAKHLYSIYRKQKTKLFSANVREYLGSRKSDNNINNNIKNTAEHFPSDFWAYNNGITILTHSFEVVKIKSKTQLKVKGISIVNGAQTTGAIGSLKKVPDASAFVPARFIQTSNQEVVNNVIQYNNSQNKVTASDFRSTDRIQKRLREEISNLPNAKYDGGRRGGHRDLIERNKNLLPSYTVGQALASFHQDPLSAYNSKSEIWISDRLYVKFFNDDTTGQHIIFCYGLLRAVEELKIRLITQSKDAALAEHEESVLSYLRFRGSTYLFCSAIAACREIFLGKRVPNAFRLSFGNKCSPSSGCWTLG